MLGIVVSVEPTELGRGLQDLKTGAWGIFARVYILGEGVCVAIYGVIRRS